MPQGYNLVTVTRKPTLSPSKISTYLACPMMYRWTYVDKRGRWYLRSKSYFSFGTTLHSVLQRFHNSHDAGVTTTEQALAALEESWVEAGYESQEEMAQAMAEGKAIVERYAESFAAEPVTSNTLFVEKTLRADLGPFQLLGRLDRIDEDEDGGLEILDYKSGRLGVTPEEVRADLAMGCYQLLVRHNFPGRPVRATIVAVRTGARASYGLSDEEAQEFESDIVFLGRQILHRDYEGMSPVGKAICLDCDFLPLCRQHPDFSLPEAVSRMGDQ